MRLISAATLFLLTFISAAEAYVGPGAGISLIGSVIGLFAALGTAIGLVVMMPLRAARKKAKARQAGTPPQT